MISCGNNAGERRTDVANLEYSDEGCDASWFEHVVSRVVKRSGGVKNGILGEIEDGGDVGGNFGGAFYASFDLFEVVHDGRDLIDESLESGGWSATT